MQISHENESEHDIDIEVVGVGLASEDWDFRSFSAGTGPNPADPAEVVEDAALRFLGALGHGELPALWGRWTLDSGRGLAYLDTGRAHAAHKRVVHFRQERRRLPETSASGVRSTTMAYGIRWRGKDSRHSQDSIRIHRKN